MKKVCKECGSENVVKDAWASWDEETKRWVLEDFFDNEFCKDCDGETTIIDQLEKTFYIQYNVGKVKYLINYYDGVSTHKDGSKFFNIKTANNIKTLNKLTKELTNDGYTEKSN